jgi:hypothetical protein
MRYGSIQNYLPNQVRQDFAMPSTRFQIGCAERRRTSQLQRAGQRHRFTIGGWASPSPSGWRPVSPQGSAGFGELLSGRVALRLFGYNTDNDTDTSPNASGCPIPNHHNPTHTGGVAIAAAVTPGHTIGQHP